MQQVGYNVVKFIPFESASDRDAVFTELSELAIEARELSKYGSDQIRFYNYDGTYSLVGPGNWFILDPEYAPSYGWLWNGRVIPTEAVHEYYLITTD
mgnify:CR=1 FL=1